MNIVADNPPHNIRELCEQVFDLGKTKPVFTFRDAIYNPHGIPITKDMVVHEATHTEQQGENPATWWDRYFTDAQFRFEQELAAYRNQYQFSKTAIKDRNRLFRYLHEMAGDLAGPMYGNLVTHSEALTLIKKEVI